MTESPHDERQRSAPALNGSRVWTAITLIGLALLIATILVAHSYSPTS